MDAQSGRYVFGFDSSSELIPTEGAEFATLERNSGRRRNPANGFRELPNPTGPYPFHLELGAVLGSEAISDIAAAGKLVFHVIGDTGQKSHGAEAQEGTADLMSVQASPSLGADRARFIYHVGDVVYFDGDLRSYEEQFYEPYKNYPAPIFAIPGNHDVAVARGNTPLQGFMENFCSTQPMHHPLAGESNRTTMTQPHCFWTLLTPFARIIGLNSNNPGQLDNRSTVQFDWFVEELRRVDDDKALIVAIHHCPYSRDTSHGGYRAIEDALDRAFEKSGVYPHLVLNGHVHNYQRFSRDLNEFGINRDLSYVVVGASGFAGFNSLHPVDPRTALPAGIEAVMYVDSRPGFLQLEISSSEIHGRYYTIHRPPHHREGPPSLRDEFHIPVTDIGARTESPRGPHPNVGRVALENPQPDGAPSPANMSDHYRQLLRGPSGGGAEAAVEATPNRGLARDAIRGRIEAAREITAKLAQKHMKQRPEIVELFDRILEKATEGLEMVANNDDQALRRSPEVTQSLEAVVVLDGSRPSFLIVDDEVDLESSPLGTWGPQLDDDAANLRGLVQRVGRIDLPGTSAGFAGTGILLRDNLIVTNRHVLQVIASQDSAGAWRFHSDVAIDFGRELGGQPSVNRRRLKRVAFFGERPIVFDSIDHAKLDMALIELEPNDDFSPPSFPLALDLSPTDGVFHDAVYTIGYPGSPVPGAYAPTILDQLFADQFGYKRLAPGYVIQSHSTTQRWTMAHDASTLGGNSGSVVVISGREGLALGLHYGGRATAPAENWAHRFSLVLDQRDGQSHRPLREVLESFGIAVRATENGHSGSGEGTKCDENSRTHAGDKKDTGRGQARRKRDWRDGITLETMQRLAPIGGLEAQGDGHTSADSLQGREGYSPDFIEGMSVPLPRPSGDIRTLRRGGSGSELRYEHFSVIMSKSRRMPILTACNIDGSESRSLPRIQRWSYDGRLNDEDQFGNELYLSNIVDRGHMVRREDPVWGTLSVARRANVDTFHYTNSCPQIEQINQQVWLGLENYILGHSRDDQMRVSVFTGPFFSDDDLVYREALIPKAFWKIVAFITDAGRFSATAYRVSQERELSDLEFNFTQYKTFQISVQQVSDDTGIDFGDLAQYDGFTQHERAHGTQLVERLERFEQIRV